MSTPSEIVIAILGIKFALIGMALSIVAVGIPLCLDLITNKKIKLIMTLFSIFFLLEFAIGLMYLSTRIKIP